MSFRNSNKRKNWIEYCQSNSNVIDDLDIGDWVFKTETNFKEFVTFGYSTKEKKEIFSFSKLSDKNYDKLFDFITSYFDMDMQNFTKFNTI
jgi:GTPase Era involved in 16S rRNA processing